MEPDLIASAEARQRHEARIRAEAMAEQLTAILARIKEIAEFRRQSATHQRGVVKTLLRREGGCLDDLAIVLERQFGRDAFPKPGSSEAPTSQIVTAPSSSAPIPPGGDRPEECPCCFSEDTPEGADCFCPDWCPEQCEGGEVHRG